MKRSTQFEALLAESKSSPCNSDDEETAMEVTITFLFGDLTQKVQDQILAQNKPPHHVYLLLDGLHIGFARDKHVLDHNSVPINAETELQVKLYETSSKLPDWLKNVKCRLRGYEMFFGHADNGLFRIGNTRAEVNTFYNHDGLSTKVDFRSEGRGGIIHHNAMRLYRMIRAGKITPRQTIELWPTIVPKVTLVLVN